MTKETTDLALFHNKAMVIMQNIANLDKQKKQLEAQDKVLRQDLQKAMDKYGVKKFENDILKITYVEPTTRTAIDSARLKKELPAIAEKYSKTSQVKGSVRIEVK
jgi:predicted phage-related endonuclease